MGTADCNAFIKRDPQRGGGGTPHTGLIRSVKSLRKKEVENLPVVLTSRHRLKQIGFPPLLEKEVRIRI